MIEGGLKDMSDDLKARIVPECPDDTDANALAQYVPGPTSFTSIETFFDCYVYHRLAMESLYFVLKRAFIE